MNNFTVVNGQLVDGKGQIVSPELLAGIVNTANANINTLVSARFNSLKQGEKRLHDIAEFKRLVIENGLIDQVKPFELTAEKEAELRTKAKQAIIK